MKRDNLARNAQGSNIENAPKIAYWGIYVKMSLFDSEVMLCTKAPSSRQNIAPSPGRFYPNANPASFRGYFYLRIFRNMIWLKVLEQLCPSKMIREAQLKK